jgi:hypothetical protein
VRVAVIVNSKEKRWDALIRVPLLPSFGMKELQELLQKVQKIDQPDNWPVEDLPVYYRIEQYGENGEFLKIVPLVLASDNRFYAIFNTYIIFNLFEERYVDCGKFWTPRFIDLILSTLT